MEYQDHLVNLLKNKLYTIDTEHSIFHRVLDGIVKKVTDDVKAVTKIGEVSYGKYKELSSSMEHVLNLLIQFSAEIQKPRESVNSVNADVIVEAVNSRLSSELTKKNKEINSMLSNQRKEIEENIKRTSDEWYQKYKELTIHLDNLEIEAQNNFKELSLEKSKSFEKHNSIIVQLKRENESMKRDILNVLERLQTLQDDWSSQNLNLSEVVTKNNEDTLNKNEDFNTRLSEIVSQVGSNERYMKEQFQYLGEKFTRLSELENQNDQLKMHFSELSDKYEGMHNCQVDRSETMKKSEYKIGIEVQETEPQREITIRELASEELEQLKSKLDSNIQKVDITAFPNSKEQFTKQLMQSQPPPPRNDNAQPNSRRGSRQRQEEMKQPLDDGWNTVGSKSLRIDASKMRLSKNVVDENSIQLGPGGGTNKFSMWSRGSYGGAQPSTDDRPAPATNRFSLLRGEEDRRNFQRSPSRGDSVSNRGMRQGPTAGHGRGKILTRSSNEGERRETLGASRPMTGGRSQNSSRDSSWNRDDHRPYGPRGSREGENVMTRSDISLRPNSDSLLPPTTVSPVPGADDQSVKKMKPLSREEMENKAKIILEEFLSVKDLEEAKLCLKELEGQTYLEVLVSSCINDVLEKSKKERDITGQFFHEMVKNNLIPCVTYFKGLSEILQFAEDMVIDIPMIWTYLAQLIVPVLIGGSVPWSDLIQVLQTSLEKSCCLKLLTEILLHAKIITSEADVARMWQSSNLEWSQFVDQSNVTKFLEDKKLQFTIAPVNESQLTVPTSGISDVARVISQVEKMLKENEHNDAIKKYINEVLPESKRNSEFIRGLMSAVAGSSITGAMKTNEDVIKARKDILQQYIKTPQMELQALYAIQALMHKLEHPSGVIFSLFNVLYDEDVISEETFKSWEISTDPSEAEGKGACSMQLTQFFTWLRENEDPEADTPS